MRQYTWKCFVNCKALRMLVTPCTGTVFHLPPHSVPVSPPSEKKEIHKQREENDPDGTAIGS